MKSAEMNADRGHPTGIVSLFPNSPEMGCLNYSTPQVRSLVGQILIGIPKIPSFAFFHGSGYKSGITYHVP